MCIAIYKPAGKTLLRTALKNCYLNNDDGCGFIYAEDGVLHWFKAVNSFRKLWRAYKKINPHDKNVVLHFRIRTSGKCDITNCHPFFVNDNLGFVHNGIISELPNDDKLNDTQMFNSLILKQLPDNWLDEPVLRSLVEHRIGTLNKMIFLDNTGKVDILNEAQGAWDDGV